MEEEKAAAYYEELTRKGSGAARFKQGLGFSTSSSDAAPERASALPSSSSFLNSFVKASNASDKQTQIESIQNKLKKNPRVSNDHRDKDRDYRDRSYRDSDRDYRDRDRERDRDKDYRDRDRERDRGRRRSRSVSPRRKSEKRRSRSVSPRQKSEKRRSRSVLPRRKSEKRRSRSVSPRRKSEKRRSRSVSPRRKSERRRSRSVSPRRKLEKRREENRGDRKGGKERSGRVDHEKVIEGYDRMTPAEKVKAKMKLQLSATAKQDEANGMGSGWERFNFDKDAPLDDEEEIEAAEDDGDLMKHIGQTFRFSAVEARREEKVKATHDEAIFGTPSLAPPVDTDSEPEANSNTKESPKTAPAASLISDQVRSLQQGSWRDRVRKA